MDFITFSILVLASCNLFGSSADPVEPCRLKIIKFFDCSSERNTLSSEGNYIAVSIEDCPGKDPTTKVWHRKNCLNVGTNDHCETWEPLTPKGCSDSPDLISAGDFKLDALLNGKDSDINSNYPIEMIIPPGGLPSNKRYRRFLDIEDMDKPFPKAGRYEEESSQEPHTNDDEDWDIVKEEMNEKDDPSNDQSRGNNCYVPNDMKTAQIRCWIWPNWMHCHQNCLNDYSIDGLRRKELNCRFSENVWKPSGFKECKNEGQCDTELISPGTLWCRYKTMSPVVCRISCLPYNSYGEVPTTEYTCEKHFVPHLPHCTKDDNHSTH